MVYTSSNKSTQILFIICLLGKLFFALVQSENLESSELVFKLEVVPDARCELGEGPHWDIETQSLYMVDLNKANLLRYDFNENKTYRASLDGETYASFIIPIEGEKDRFAVGCGRKVVVAYWDGVSKNATVERTLFSVQPEKKFALNRFNDAKCDFQGRLFGGTMNSTDDCSFLSEFYRYNSGNIDTLITNVGMSNGLSFNKELKKFYYIDTCNYNVKEFDYNPDTGDISNPRVFYDTRQNNIDQPPKPDGMTTDSDGNLFVALYDGDGILKIDPSGNLLEKIEMPGKQITSMAFGGPNLDIFFVTSSAMGKTNENAGDTYIINGLGAKGLPMMKLQL